MDYFDIFPTVPVNGIPLTDISKALVILNDIRPYLSLYVMDDNESLNDVAYKLYDQDVLYWVLYLINPGYVFNEFMSLTAFHEYMETEYNRTCLQFSEHFIPFSNLETGVTIAAFEMIINGSNITEIPVTITKIDSPRRQMVLDKLYTNPISLYYMYNDQKISIINYQFIHDYYINGYAVANYAGNLIVDGYYFSQEVYGDSIHHYTYKGSAYELYPTRIPEILVDSYTWIDYETATNDSRREINVINKEYIQNVLSIIEDYKINFEQNLLI